MKFKEYIKKNPIKYTYGDKKFNKFCKRHKLTLQITSDLQDMVWKIEDHYTDLLTKQK